MKNRMLFLFVVVLMVPHLAFSQQYDKVRERFLSMYEDSAKVDSAYLLAFQLKGLALKQYGKNSIQYLRAMNSCGLMSRAKGEIKAAKKWWYKGLRDFKDVSGNSVLVVRSAIASNLSKIYLSKPRQLDSARFFANLSVQITEGGGSVSFRQKLYSIADLAFDFDTAGYPEIAQIYYRRVRDLRGEYFGKLSASLIVQLDSIRAAVAPGKDYTEWRRDIHQPLDSAMTYQQLDTTSSGFLTRKAAWDALYYTQDLLDVALKEYGDTSTQVVKALLKLGEVYHELFEDREIGLHCVLKAKHLLEQTKKTTNVDYLNTLLQLASNYGKVFNYEKARESANLAISTAKKIHDMDSEAYADVLSQLGNIYKNLDAYSDADNSKATGYYLQSAELKKNIHGDTSGVYGVALQELGNSYIRYAALDSAEASYLKAYELFKKIGHENLYSVCRQLTFTYDYKDELAKSNFWLERSLAIKHNNIDTVSFDFLNDLSLIVYSSFETANWKRGEETLKRWENILNKHFDKTSAERMRFNDIKIAYERKRARYEGLDTLLLANITLIKDPALYLQSDLNVKSNIGTYYFTLMGIYMDQQKYGKAKEAYQSAQFYTAHKPVKHDFYLKYAELLSLTNQPDSADFYHKKGLTELQESRFGKINKLYVSQMLMNYGAFKAKNNELVEAEEIMYTSLDRIKTEMVKNMAGFSERERQQYNSELQSQLYQYYRLQQQLSSVKPEVNIKAYNLLVQSKGLLLQTSDYLQKIAKQTSDTALVAGLKKLKTLKKEIAGAYQNEISPQAIDSLHRAVTKLEQKLSFESPAFEQFQQQNTVGFEEVRRNLNPNEAAIEWLQYPVQGQKMAYAAIIIKANVKAPIYVPINIGDSILTFIKNQGVAGRGVTVKNKSKDLPLAKRLYEAIWKPIHPHLSATKTIYLAADGIFNNVSFVGMKSEADQYLIDNFDFRFMFNTKEIATLKKPQSTATKPTIALFGGALYDEENQAITSNQDSATRSLPNELSGKQAWEYLPNTLIEIEQIASVLGAKKWRVKTFSGADASENNFKKLGNVATVPRIVHVATHGFYFAQSDSAQTNSSSRQLDPLFRSGLIFSAANYAWKGEKVKIGAEDGVLSAYEMANLDLNEVELMVLSACETGVGDNMIGEGVFGLQRAVKMAGVKKMLVSLWPVPDKETSEMMQFFYQGISKGKSIPDAFKNAQRQMRTKFAQQPVLWSGFVLIE